MTISIPPGTVITTMGPVVTVVFKNREQAKKFLDFFEWIDNNPSDDIEVHFLKAPDPANAEPPTNLIQ